MITDQVYDQMYDFAYHVSMMNLDDVEARNFIYRFLLKCGRENYLTEDNWKKVYNNARDTMGMGITEAEDFTRQFFLDFQSL